MEEDIILGDPDVDPEQADVSEVSRTGIRMALRRSGGHVLAVSSYVVLALRVSMSLDFSNRLYEDPRTKMLAVTVATLIEPVVAVWVLVVISTPVEPALSDVVPSQPLKANEATNWSSRVATSGTNLTQSLSVAVKSVADVSLSESPKFVHVERPSVEYCHVPCV